MNEDSCGSVGNCEVGSGDWNGKIFQVEVIGTGMDGIVLVFLEFMMSGSLVQFIIAWSGQVR